MVFMVACCRGVFTVAGWFAAGLTVTGVLPRGAQTPALIWQVGGEGRGTPAVQGETAYFLSKRHELVAVDRRRGRVRWRQSTGGPGDTTLGATVVATPQGVIAGDYDVVAFDHEGRLRWRFAARDDGHGAGVYLGGVVGDVVFAGSLSGHLVAIDARTGSARWLLRLGTDDDTTVFAPAAAASAVAVGFTSFRGPPSGGLAVVDARDGRLRWRRPLPARGESPARVPVVAGGPLFIDDDVLVAGSDGRIHAFDVRSGRLRWALPPAVAAGADSPPDYRALAWTGQVLVAGSLTGIVTAFDVASRTERWRRQSVEASVAQGIASDGDTVYVPHLSGQLVALDADDGREVWRAGSDGAGFAWMPLVAGGEVFAAASSAGFFALAAASRRLAPTGRR